MQAAIYLVNPCCSRGTSDSRRHDVIAYIEMSPMEGGGVGTDGGEVLPSREELKVGDLAVNKIWSDQES